ncbi:uncharacterized protein LOC113341915 [Papaver somniferum]|uniref:uncharacterized protein LOC113341915 n=1 Tax=Papaver somniferum TaxID=3469 RepID=UPI000E6F7269|nr:uncharacterized protein LOC113341915 [Papaver somniferum]
MEHSQRGLNDLRRRDIVKQKIKDWKPYIILLQETKIQQCNDLIVWKCWSKKSVQWLDSPSQGSSGGNLCLWDSDKIEVLDSLIVPYSISLHCENVENSFECIFTGVYASCASNSDEVKLFWRDIKEVRCFWDYPWVIGGDFNEIRYTHERSSGGEVTARMRRFNNFISKHHLIDLPLLGATFTWTNNQANYALFFCKKLQLLKVKLKEWRKLEFGDVDRRLEELENIFVNLDAEENANNGISQDKWEERIKARQEYCKLTITGAEKWRSRSRTQSYRTVTMEGMDFSSDDMSLWLERDIDKEECVSAIKSLGQNKAPRTDGFPTSFYKLCWEVLKEDFMKVVKELQHNNFLDWRLQNTFIALIPKKNIIEEIKDLRPISLVNGAYKIVSKILAERFKQCLPHIISPNQTTFIKKMQFLDGVLIANELIDLRIRSGKPGILYKIYFEKTFDHVNWDFLDEILSLMGFGTKWRTWIRRWVEFAKFYVLVNGSVAGYFKIKKGIRQGDPISPFLFLLVGEALNFMIKQAQEQGILTGFQVKPDVKIVSHLQFADDTLIFLDADVEQVRNLRLVLLSFEILTGLKINFSKSQIYGVGYDGDLSIFSSILGYYHGSLPTCYLGLPLGDKKKKFGGLGIKNLQLFNKDLLSKWSWIFAVEDNPLWKSIVVEKYGFGVVDWVSKNPKCSYGHSVWRGIMKHNAAFSKHVKFKVNNGIHVRFWDDNLLIWFLSKFNLDSDDELQWGLTKNAKFLVKSLYDKLIMEENPDPIDTVFAHIWKLNCPPKTSFFLWLIAHKRLSTRDFLIRRGVNVPADCLFCDEVESCSHLLLHCNFARKIWEEFFNFWCISKERNAKVFTDKRSTARIVVKKAIYCLFTWALAIKDFESLNCSDVMKDWNKLYFDPH